MAVTKKTFAENPNARWQRKLRNHHEALIQAGIAGRAGSDVSQWLVGCTGVELVAVIEEAAERSGRLAPGETFWQRRGRRKHDLQIEHRLLIRTCLSGDWERAREVLYFRNLSITTTSTNSGWDRQEFPFALLPPLEDILASYRARHSRGARAALVSSPSSASGIAA